MVQRCRRMQADDDQQRVRDQAVEVAQRPAEIHVRADQPGQLDQEIEIDRLVLALDQSQPTVGWASRRYFPRPAASRIRLAMV